jgi:hypothetical protein
VTPKSEGSKDLHTYNFDYSISILTSSRHGVYHHSEDLEVSSYTCEHIKIISLSKC